MSYLSLLILLFVPQVATTQPAETPPAVTYDKGPLKAEITAMREIRYSATDPEMAARLRSELGMQIRVSGEKITKVVRHGNVIFTEMVDDTGTSLVDDTTYSDADKDMTRPPMFPAERLRTDGLILTTRNTQSTRGARTLKTLRGYIRLVLADNPVQITVVNPLQYHGKTIEEPRLAELGVEIEILPVDEIENAPPANRCIVFRYKSKGEHVQKARFYDGSLKPISARDTWSMTKRGEQVQLYYFDGSGFNDEMQVVFDVNPEIEDIQLPIEMTDVELP